MQRLRFSTGTRITGKAGFSLAEVMIALLLFGLMATGFTQACMFARKSAESAVAENVALNVALGYMNQLKTFTYGVLMASANDPTVALPTMSSATATDYLYQNAYVTKTVIMQRDSTGATVLSMDVDIMPVISDASGGTNWSIAGIQIFYRWRDPVTNNLRTASIRNAMAQ